MSSSWELLSTEEQERYSKLNKFFCGLHILVNLADCAVSKIAQFEAAYQEEDKEDAAEQVLDGESGTIRLIRDASKCFSRDADLSNGCHSDFKAFCDTINDKVRFVSYRGHRFNITFYLAQVLYYHHSNVIKFLGDIYGTPNDLLRNVYRLSQNNLYVAGCKVLGLFSKLVTAPLWRLIEENTHILDMNGHYMDLVAYLDEVMEDATGFLDGSKFPFDEDLIKKDDEYVSLVKENKNVDSIAVRLAQLLAGAFSQLIRKAMAEHLPGGSLITPSSELIDDTQSTLAHNKLSESVFGRFDHMLRYRPNASTLTNEAYIMYSTNKTGEWLEKLPAQKKEKLFAESRKGGRELRKKFRERCQGIKVKKMENIRKKQEDKSRVEKKRAKKKR
ncbi:uncharacterized protein LOC144361819 [Saccoglossus kowalevskii]